MPKRIHWQRKIEGCYISSNFYFQQNINCNKTCFIGTQTMHECKTNIVILHLWASEIVSTIIRQPHACAIAHP